MPRRNGLCQNLLHPLGYPGALTRSGECAECKNARNHWYEYTPKGRKSRFYRHLREQALAHRKDLNR